MRFEDITHFASPSFGFLERGCDGSTYLCCTEDGRTPDDDPVERGGKGREVSGNRITGLRMHAVLISPEYWWMEAACLRTSS